MAGHVGLRGTKLKCHFAVFDRRADLRRYWKDLTMGVPEQHAVALATGLAAERWQTSLDVVTMVDPIYFAALAFLTKHLTMEIVVHEAIHAGIYFSRRANGRNLWHPEDDNPDEPTCYAGGLVATALLVKFIDEGLLEW
jgi:hypothetical protein